MDTEVNTKIENEREDEQKRLPEDTFLELGSVSKDTQSSWTGFSQDGGWGFTWG